MVFHLLVCNQTLVFGDYLTFVKQSAEQKS